MVLRIIGHLMDTYGQAQRARSFGYKHYEGFYLGPCGLWRGHYDPATCSIEHGHDLYTKREALNGYGIFFNAYDGRKYEGEWRSSELLIGGSESCKILRNQDLYVGHLRDGKPHGPGKIWFGYQQRAMPSQIWGDGDAGYFEGYFKDGRFHGKGSFQWGFGVSYTGEFFEGKRHGKFLFSIEGELSLELHFDNDNLKGCRVLSPANHPLLSTDIAPGRIYRDSYHEHYVVGDPDHYCLKLSTDGFVPSYFYMGESKNGDGHGQGVRMYFSQNHCVIEKGVFAKSALFGVGHRQSITHFVDWGVDPTSWITLIEETGQYFNGKIKEGGSRTESFVREKTKFQKASY